MRSHLLINQSISLSLSCLMNHEEGSVHGYWSGWNLGNVCHCGFSSTQKVKGLGPRRRDRRGARAGEWGRPCLYHHFQGVLQQDVRCREERRKGSGVRKQSCSVQKRWQINLVLPLIRTISEPLCLQQNGGEASQHNRSEIPRGTPHT